MDDYNNILYSNFQYKLPEIEVGIIKNLLKELGSILEEPYVEEKIRYKRQTHKRSNGIKKTDESWEKTKPFVVTKLEKKEGVDKIMSDIKNSLNKVSNKNYEVQRDLLRQYLTDVALMECGEETIIKIKNALIDTACTNKFYSEIYVELYKELQDLFMESGDLEEFITVYEESINSIEFVDSNVNYDKYCDNNKLNDKRKGMAMFIVNLMKKGLMEKNRTLEIIIRLQELVLKYIDEENKMAEVEEITENIFLLITLSSIELNNKTNWKSVMDNVVKCSQMKVKDHKSISSRTIFKYMDMLDNKKS
jgi:hypothetical protein